MKTIDFKNIGIGAKLFKDFLERKQELVNCYPNSFSDNHAKYFDRLVSRNEKRELSFSLINSSMELIVKSSRQVENISKIHSKTTLFVTTGQQVGFLGGPQYTAFKIASAISKAKKLQKEFPNYNFIPLFWLEDNDHDSKEAGEVYVYNTAGEPQKFSVLSDDNDRKSVSELYFEEGIEELITNVIDSLPYSQFKNETAQLLESIYRAGNSWSDAMLLFCNALFAESGLLIVRASHVRKSGVFGKFAEKNLVSHDEIDRLDLVLNNSKSYLESNGYVSNIRIEKSNYCLQFGIERYVLRTSENAFNAGNAIFTLEDLQRILQTEPARISPKVLLRPIFQDMIFANAHTILGPGEIGYYGLLAEAYNYFGIEMPPVSMRLSASFLSDKQRDFIEENKLDPEFFMRSISDIEADLSGLIADEYSEKEFRISQENISNAFIKLKPMFTSVDPSFDRTIDSSLHKTLDLLENLKKKYISALKKKNFDSIQKYRKIHNYMFLNNKPQERSYSAVNAINFFGIKKYVNILNELADKDVKEHIIL